ncbi:hypothetical protein NP493_583g02032 [Ridgeia piscesae]|uniref:Sulphur transport domain-containing protein n=1 Tax=Ridgeia piscesae TaxID=27915 RepID=A0AAD9KVV2_RIDPI|nr:hypothetical protein NP493_583g02032 [Ridgeia piscesae]
MVFRRWIMLKMFLTAIASGQIIMSLCSVVPATERVFKDAVDGFKCCLVDKGLFTSTVGPFILGVGMTLSGSCPGMILIQLGSGCKNSYYTLIGTLVGALLYSLFAQPLVKYTKPKKALEKPTVGETLGVKFYKLALPMAVMLVISIFLLEWFINWETDLSPHDLNANTTGTANIMTVRSWPPSVAGVIVGLLQLFIIISVGDTLGGSSAYVTIVSQWVVTKRLQERFPYMANARCGIGNWWQVSYVLATVIGASLSAMSSNSIGDEKGVTIATAITGGILLLFGARLAAGCTSGHGLSGMALLYWLSIVAVPAMFAGGIGTAFAMDATGALNTYVNH